MQCPRRVRACAKECVYVIRPPLKLAPRLNMSFWPQLPFIHVVGKFATSKLFPYQNKESSLSYHVFKARTCYVTVPPPKIGPYAPLLPSWPLPNSPVAYVCVHALVCVEVFLCMDSSPSLGAMNFLFRVSFCNVPLCTTVRGPSG